MDQDDQLANALRRQDERRAAVLADETEVPYCPPCGLCVNCDRQKDPNEAFARDCGGHWEGNDWLGCGVCARCREVEDAASERRRTERRESL